MTRGRVLTIAAIAVTFAATIAGYLWFMRSPHFATFMSWADAHRTALLVTLVVWKIAAIVWPPLPGSLITFGSIPIVGWLPAYLADFIGSFCGAAIAYWIAQRWGIAFVRHLLGANAAEKIASVKIPPHREFEAVFVFRILGAGLIEAICYAAGILKIHFGKFIAAILISHAALGLPAFYFGREIFAGRFLTSILLFAGFALVLLFLRKRYFS
jgi:uncharacterized membrane protein YdjX (TVP38/TMEM64 family)